MYLRFSFFLVLFALIHKNCLALKSCNNAYSYKNGYCIYHSECRHFDKIQNAESLEENMQKTFEASYCNLNDQIICCKENDLKKKVRPPIITTTLPPEVIKAKRLKGLKLLEKSSCGIIHYTKTSHGKNVAIGEYPWMALMVSYTNGFQVICGGSLITNRHILTAAHCFQGNRIEKVLLGVHNTSRKVEYIYDKGRRKALRVEKYTIDKFVVHPKYNEFSKENDIALITLDRVVTHKGKFNKYIRPICLPITAKSRKNNITNEYIAAGWGTTENEKQSDVLLEINVTVNSLDYCRENVLNVDQYKDIIINDNQICAGGDTLQDTCTGDSGGPLFFPGPYGNADKYVQHGITSFGNPECGMKASPSIYTKVFPFIDWIAENLA